MIHLILHHTTPTPQVQPPLDHMEPELSPDVLWHTMPCLESKDMMSLVQCSKSVLRVWTDSPVLQARWLVAHQQQGQYSIAVRAVRSGRGRQLLSVVLRLLPPSFDCTRDLLHALLLAVRNGATDHIAALLLHFRTSLDQDGRRQLLMSGAPAPATACGLPRGVQVSGAWGQRAAAKKLNPKL